ncbi:MAG TPA: NUDIX hydrolase [Anaerolineaceae bacterium]|jgi:ADP-ribose pyrophosphatase YjhB (NUDIX family)
MVGNGEKWLAWAREIQAIGQTGLHFNTNEFDQERYRRLIEISADIFQEYTGVARDDLVNLYLAQSGYATPKVDVRAAIFRDRKLLLVQERTDEGWSMPGGWADVNEAPSTAAVREVWEESGFRVRPVKLVGVFEANHDRPPIQVFHAFKIVFLCDLVGGEARVSSETTAVAFFPQDEIPVLSVERTPLRVIEEAYAHLYDPARPTAFE